MITVLLLVVVRCGACVTSLFGFAGAAAQLIAAFVLLIGAALFNFIADVWLGKE